MHLIAAHAGLPVTNPGPDAPSPTARRVRKETPPVAPDPPTKPPPDPPRRHSATLLRTTSGYDAFDCCWGTGSLRLSVRNGDPLTHEEAQTVEPPDAFNQIVTHLAAGQPDRVVTRLTTLAEAEAAMVGLTNDLRASLKALNKRLPWLRLTSF